MQRPSVLFQSIFSKHASQSREIHKYGFEKIDSLSLWIIGLSIGTIYAIVTNFKELTFLLSCVEIKYILLLLFISVVSGIFCRFTYIYYYVLVDTAFRQIEILLSDLEMADTEPNLTGTETFEELVELISQFYDRNYLLSEYNNSSIPEKTDMYNNLILQYKTETVKAKEELHDTLSIIENAYKISLGEKLYLINPKPKQNEKNVFKIKLFRLLFYILFFIFISTFLFSLGYFLWHIYN